MDPVLKAILFSWDWRLDVLVVLALAGTLYTMGWWRLGQRKTAQTISPKEVTRRSRRWSLASRWRPASYWLGLSIVLLSLMSPIDVLAAQLFSMHMVQHLLLIMVAPPLLLLANPLPFLLWGMPDRVRRTTGRVMGQLMGGDAKFRSQLRAVTTPGMTWMFWTITVIGWHDPGAYNAALRSQFVHDIEHLSFFLAGMLFWWHVTGAGPRIHKQPGLVGRILFVISIIPPNMVSGIVLAFASEPFYGYAGGFLGVSAIADQQLGGVIMWIPGSMMYIVAALLLAARLLGQEQQKPSLPESLWGTDEALLAPGLEQTHANSGNRLSS
jgi:cytochrome c oxidase assembly factor CtaG